MLRRLRSLALGSALLAALLVGTACRSAETGLPTLTPTGTHVPASPTVASTGTQEATSQAPTPTPIPTVTPVIYVIRPGDTLSGIAMRFDLPVEQIVEANQIDDPNVIAAGQRLVIPVPTPTGIAPTPTPLPTDTPTPVLPPSLEIVDVIGRGAPSAETVVIANRGRGVSLDGWSLRDAQGNAYVFPHLYLAPGAEVRVHTGAGQDTPLHLYWGREEAVWDEVGDTAILADQNGVMYATRPVE